MIEKIVIMSQEEALRMLPKMEDTAVVSIVGKDQANPVWEGARLPVYNVSFDDTEDSMSETCAEAKDFSGLKSFLDTADAKTLVVHCYAGISRSAGVAAAIAEYLGIRMRIWTNRHYDPNVLVYELVKKSLAGEKEKERKR